ncbi:MAG: hypothetical protein COA81_02015 [Alphaproteobacteria bacterium]|nr:MAG: hypothetical protein COA81_02015 [Alphaproteobacteria bacterium]
MVPFISVESDDHIQVTLKSVLGLTLAEALHQNFLDVLTTGKTINIMAGDVDRITTPLPSNNAGPEKPGYAGKNYLFHCRNV